MRHNKAGRKLGRNASHRKAMYRNMVTSLFEHGKIQTTDAKAKELRKIADKLILEVWTDGSVRPDDAVAYAAKILKDQVQVFINFEEAGDEEEAAAAEAEPTSHNPNLDRKVSELELSVRAANCLRAANIRYIGELVQKTDAEMLKTKNFGRKSLNEIKDFLQNMNLHLGMEIYGWTPPEEDQEEEEI